MPLPSGDISADGDVLERLAIVVKKRANSGIDPIKGSILGTISYLPVPDFSLHDSAPEVFEELFGVIA